MTATTTASHSIPDTSGPSERIGDDIIIGARKIADELGLPLHAVYYLAAKQRLPIGRLGRNLIASRSKLRRAALALAS